MPQRVTAHLVASLVQVRVYVCLLEKASRIWYILLCSTSSSSNATLQTEVYNARTSLCAVVGGRGQEFQSESFAGGMDAGEDVKCVAVILSKHCWSASPKTRTKT